ncbi:D-alanine--D-alanine ligase [Leptospira barantonii]|uniref:D-alanine--D-alanine ligase n=1 Tax=Leptospira barantonii TaxID=2023184 RepID=A0ABX4NGG1_9LEPT|nr:D-alanine--D-alanine ligase [Leptospira barantonii]PJZ55879.1 D-alanine--D-alanine ligase [Leptospira barantonii]
MNRNDGTGKDLTIPTVLVYADLHEFEGEFPEIYKQEWESAKSVDAILELLNELGEKAELIFTPEELSKNVMRYSDLEFRERPVLFHLMEGFRSRNREALIPAVAEMFGFPHTGSDSYAQNVSLDKNLTRIFADSIGVPIVLGFPIRSPKDYEVPEGFSFPGFLKPAGEGSSLGVGEESVVIDANDLRLKLSSKPSEFFPYLMEEYLKGTEYTISVMGSKVVGYRASSAGRLVLKEDLKVEDVYGEKTKSKSVMPETLVFDCETDLETFLQEQSLLLCRTLETSGPARLDWKTDSLGNPFFLEINLTPGLSPFYSTFPICYRQSLGDEKTLFQEILKIARSDFETDRFAYSKKKTGNLLTRK